MIAQRDGSVVILVKVYSVLLLAIGILLSSAGQSGAQEQEGSTVRIRRSPFLAQLQPNRVAVVTTHNRLDRLHEQDIFSRAVAEAMGGSLGIQASVIEQRLCAAEMPYQSGTFDEYFLVAMHNQFSVDAVVYCEVVEFNAYAPYSLRGHIVVVDTREAVSLLECELNLELGCPEVRRFFQRYIDESEVRAGLSTPKKFLDYCARVGVSSMGRAF